MCGRGELRGAKRVAEVGLSQSEIWQKSVIIAIPRIGKENFGGKLHCFYNFVVTGIYIYVKSANVFCGNFYGWKTNKPA